MWKDGREEPVNSIILATGYHFQPDYLAGLGAWNAEAQVLQRSGCSFTVPGFFYVGFFFLRPYASATLRGVAMLVVRQTQH